MSDNLYTVSIETNLSQNPNNITIELVDSNSIEVINNTTVLVGDLPQGYPLDWTVGNLSISRVSGLDIVGGSGIDVTNNSGSYTVAVTGNFGLTSEEVDDRINDLLIGGNNISLNYDDNLNTLTISASGLQPSGNYSLIGHSHLSSNITNFNSAVSGLLPVKNISSGSGISVINNSGDFNVSVTGQFGLTSEQVDDRVSNLLVAGSYINLNYDDNFDSLTISATGLQPSGNYANSGHTHTSSDITDFNSAVSGLIPNIPLNNYGDNRVLTSDGTPSGIYAESNLTFSSGELRINDYLTISDIQEDYHLYRYGYIKCDGPIIIEPSGSSSLQISSSGIDRGVHAIDFQKMRSEDHQVAYGSYSFIGGGRDNTANNDYSIVVGGANNLVNAPYGFIGNGFANNVSANNSSVLGGYGNSVQGTDSVIGGGGGNIVQGRGSVIPGGYSAKTTKYGELSHSAGRFNNNGDAQHTILIVKNRTTPADIGSYQRLVLGYGDVPEYITIPQKTIWTFDVKVSCYIEDDHNGAWWIIRGGVKRVLNNSASLIGSVITEYDSDTELFNISSVDVSTDPENDTLEIRVFPINKNVRWVGVVDITQVSFF